MTRVRSVILGLFAVASLAACVQTNAVRLGNAPARAAVAPEAVAVYRTADQVPSKYEEVAILNSTGESRFTNEEKMFKSMQKKAAQLGANGVILDGISEPSAGAKVASAALGVSAQRKGRAIAIYVFPADTVRASK